MPRLLAPLLFALIVGLPALFGTPSPATARDLRTLELPAAMLKRHAQFPDCIKPGDPQLPDLPISFMAPLDEHTQIVGIACDLFAYNATTAVYIVRNGDYADAERVYFPDFSRKTGWMGSPVLFDASYDERRHRLSGFYKGRGLADCGTSSRYKWDGDQLVLVEFRAKDNCNGKVDKRFPLIYKRPRKAR